MWEEFSEIIWKLIVGEGVSFLKYICLEIFVEFLLDFNDLEMNSKVLVNGVFIVCSEYNVILDDLFDCEFEFVDCLVFDDFLEVNLQVFMEIFFQVYFFFNIYMFIFVFSIGVFYFKNVILLILFFIFLNFRCIKKCYQIQRLQMSILLLCLLIQ